MSDSFGMKIISLLILIVVFTSAGFILGTEFSKSKVLFISPRYAPATGYYSVNGEIRFLKTGDEIK